MAKYKLYEELSNILSPDDILNSPMGDNETDLEYTKLLSVVAHCGGMIRDIDTDTFTVKVNNKDSFNAVADVLDDSDIVDFYEANLYEIEPFSGIAKKLDTNYIDVDMIDSFANFVATYIVFLKQDTIDYSQYVDMLSNTGNDDTQEDTESELTEVILNKSKKVPLWVSLNGTKTITPKGTFFIIPHPVEKNKVLIHIEYTISDEYDDVDSFYKDNKRTIKQDVDNINHGFIMHQLINKNFVCETPLQIDENNLKVQINKNNKKVLEFGTAVYSCDENVNVIDILESFDGSKINGDVAILSETKRLIKINSLGKKLIKIKCKPGFKYDVERKACIAITGKDLAVMRKARIKMVRSKKAQGTTLKTMTLRKTKKALRFRKMFGV